MGKYKLPLGFRFHPTDVELLKYYLKRKVLGKKFSFEAIAELDIYKHAPWDLPDMSLLKTGDLKWFFFCPVEKKYSKGARLNRATVYGYWKTTGKDKPIMYNGEVVGMMKTLVFHRGKAPHGDRTDWVMHEYRLEDKELADRGVVQDSYVLSVVYNKDGVGPRNSAQYGAPFKEEDWSEEDKDGNFGGTCSSHVPENLSAEPSVQSSGLHTLAPPVSNTKVAVSHTTDIDHNVLPSVVPSDTNAANMDAPPEEIVVDDEAVHALTEGPQLAQVRQSQESDDNILSMLEIFTEDDATFDTYYNGQMTGNAKDFSFEAPQDSGKDSISLMLASFTEEERWENVFYPQVQESNDNILSMLKTFTEDDAAFVTYNNGQMTGNANDFTFEAPQDSEDDSISLMLASFKEEDRWYNVF